MRRAWAGRSDAMNTLIREALGGLPPPPCEAPVRCPHLDTCAQGASCAAFDRYLASRSGLIVREPWERPSAGRYRRLFRAADEEGEGDG